MTLKNQWLKKPSIKTEVLIKLYKQGLTTTQIGEKVGLRKSSVGRRLKKAGISLRRSANYEGPNRYWLWKGEDHLDPVVRKRNQRKLRKWSKAVRERDGNTCKDCGMTSKRLHAHHIIRLEECINSSLEFDISNGVTLCPKCHKTRHKQSKD
jgi:5-methylcytosine-specific restriction endonuclease McrA